MKYFVLMMMLHCSASLNTTAQNSNAIIGKWIALPKKNVIVEVYKDQDEFKGRVVWFRDTDDKSKPMNVRADEKNPDKSLRSRKLLGMEVLRKLVYNPQTNKWEHGEIYDALSGKKWSSMAWLPQDNLLKVSGFWLVELFGKIMEFERV